MAYSSKYSKRPDELASKSSHSNIINDKDVKAFINDCEYPKSKDDITLDPALIVNIEYPDKNPIEHIIAIDGSYSTVPVKKHFHHR
ncbi:MAG: hypothetical protein IPJ54_01500 [Saprospiraceae bacterium]|nr:hypothetical protein [Saprospiraceae bacterium]